MEESKREGHNGGDHKRNATQETIRAIFIGGDTKFATELTKPEGSLRRPVGINDENDLSS